MKHILPPPKMHRNLLTLFNVLCLVNEKSLLSLNVELGLNRQACTCTMPLNFHVSKFSHSKNKIN